MVLSFLTVVGMSVIGARGPRARSRAAADYFLLFSGKNNPGTCQNLVEIFPGAPETVKRKSIFGRGGNPSRNRNIPYGSQNGFRNTAVSFFRHRLRPVASACRAGRRGRFV